jgi:hypothetical protein
MTIATIIGWITICILIGFVLYCIADRMSRP